MVTILVTTDYRWPWENESPTTSRRCSSSPTSCPRPPAHPFYQKLNQILANHQFDPFVENLCQTFYHDTMGRPSIPPGTYFRLLFLGYFEGIDSERGIAWRVGDSLSARAFVGYQLYESAHDHTTISRTRRLIDLETHHEVFGWVLKVLAGHDLIDGKTVGVDATMLEANAAIRSIVRRDTGESYTDFLTRLAIVISLETPLHSYYHLEINPDGLIAESNPGPN